MEKTNFTFVSPLRTLMLLLAFAWAGLNTAAAQCPAPINLATPTVTATSATVTWASAVNPVDTDHSFQLLLQIDADGGVDGPFVFVNQILQFSANQPLTATFNNLVPSSGYRICIREDCDDNAGSTQEPLPCITFQTLATPFTVVVNNIDQTTCPANSPGFVADASFDIVVGNGSCAGTYNIVVAGAPATTPTNFAGVAAGTYSVTNAGVGPYTVTVTETSGCVLAPGNNPVVRVVTVAQLQGADTVDPLAYIADFFTANFVATNDPVAQAQYGITANANFGDVTIPEGDCGRQDKFTIVGIDDCDGFLLPAFADVRVASVTSVSPFGDPIQPGTQATVIENQDGFGNWVLDVHWSVGISVITIEVEDASGNVTTLTLRANVIDNVFPVIAASAANYTVPTCATGVTAVYGFTISDQCEQVLTGDIFNALVLDGRLTASIVGANFSFNTAAFSFLQNTNGYIELTLTNFRPTTGQTATGFLNLSYTDSYGNVTLVQPEITVNRAAADQPPVIIASTENLEVSPCTDEVVISYGFTVTDDCQDIILANVGLAVPGAANVALDYSEFVNGNNRALYVEYAVTLAAGATYFPTITYNNAIGQTAEVTPAIVVFQAADTDPVVVMPGNLNVTVPVCEDAVETVWSITISDNCDAAADILAGATFTFGGVAIFPSYTALNGNQVYFEFTQVLDIADDGDLLIAFYDGTVVDALVNVIAQEDEFAPIVQLPSQTIFVALDPCSAAPAVVPFNVNAIDNCGNVAAVVTTSGGTLAGGPGNGAYTLTAQPGTYTITATATDAAGNVTTRTFQIVVTRAAAPATNLACVGNLNVTLNPAVNTCTVTVTPEMVLNGNFGCLTPANFVVTVGDGNQTNGGVVDGCGTFPYSISLVGGSVPGFNSPCWGTILAEDKTPPVIFCPANTDERLSNGKDLICEDLSFINLSSTGLPTTGPDAVARCYKVTANGTVVAGQGAAVQRLLVVLGYTGLPTAQDNCGNIEICVNDVITNGANPMCDDVTVTRTFTAKDKQDSACVGQPNALAVCTQIITVRKPNFGDVMVPDPNPAIDCATVFATDANGNPHPSVTGFPTVMTAFAAVSELNQTYCNLSATYVDGPRIVTCAPSSYKIVRTWTLLDWCDGLTTYTQTIKVGDDEAPVIVCANLPNNGLYSTSPFTCTATITIPAATITDNCSNFTVLAQIVTTIQEPIFNQFGQIIGYTPVTVVVATAPVGTAVPGIPIGCHRFRYTATDACGNSSVLECPFSVEDLIAPTAICDDQLNISIGGAGNARVFADAIDEGSNDACGPIRIEIRRCNVPLNAAGNCTNFSPWGEFVDFTCTDVNRMVRIELRVWDDRNGDGIPGNTIPVVQCDGTTALITDNSNICWLDVLIEDKIRPICTPPAAASIRCDELPYDFDPASITQLQNLFGNATGVDNCPTVTVEELTPNTAGLDDCAWGTIVRTFRARDAKGNVSNNPCTQVVTINQWHDYWILFPEDAEGTCGEYNYGGVTVGEIGCDLLAVQKDSIIFEASGDECFKIFYTYRVINWCEYNGIDQPVVVGRDEDCNGTPGYTEQARFPNNGLYVIVRGVGATKTTWYDSDLNFANNFPAAGMRGTACGPNNPAGHWVNSTTTPAIRSRGYWQYTQHVKVYDDVKPVLTVVNPAPFCALYDDCTGDVTLDFSVDENCTPDDVTVVVKLNAFNAGTLVVIPFTGTYPNYNVSGNFPIGNHTFVFHVEDGCGNFTGANVPFTVVDCKAPTPICISGLTVTLMPQPGGGGAMAIWASDFIASPITDCTEPIKYSINKEGEAIIENQTGIVFTCDDFNPAPGESTSTVFVEIYAWDSANNPYSVQPDGTVGGPNYGHCVTFVSVQDHMGACGSIVPTGSIAGLVATETATPVANVDVTLSGAQMIPALTSTAGAYSFNNLVSGGDFTVTPFRDVQPLNGVSTFDLVLISQHILGIQPLNSPYKMIAADANNSGNITTFDLITLRRLILSLDTEFTSNTSWRFVRASYQFPVPTNPWFEAFPEVISINNLAGNLTAQDFVAVKVGDVNGSVVLNFNDTDDRNAKGVFAFNVADADVKAGNEYTVSFTAGDIASILGYQFTLSFDNGVLELVDVVNGVATEENFGMRFVNEGMITTSWNGTANAEDVLFSLVFRAKAEGQLSNLLNVSSRYTVAEAYNKSNELLNVGINFTNGTVATAGFEVYQNVPNPFKGETMVGFNLPADAQVTVTVADVTGKVLQVTRMDGQAGRNNVTLNSANLPASGVLYYTVATGEFTATKKMIIIE